MCKTECFTAKDYAKNKAELSRKLSMLTISSYQLSCKILIIHSQKSCLGFWEKWKTNLMWFWPCIIV